jgi:hypothetical protein
MTDRIRAEFEKWVKDLPPTDGVPDLSFHQGRYNRAVIRHMWAAWQAQAERITDMAAALERIAKGRDAALSRRVPLERRVGRQNVKRSDHV